MILYSSWYRILDLDNCNSSWQSNGFLNGAESKEL